MSKALKLFFDENLSLLLAKEIFEFYKSDYPLLEIRHLTEFTRKGAPDSDWTGLLKAGPNWIVVSADRGVNSRPDEKLPLICKKYGISCILLSGKLSLKTKAEHKQAIVGAWQQIVAFSGLPKGTEARLCLTQAKGIVTGSSLRIRP